MWGLVEFVGIHCNNQQNLDSHEKKKIKSQTKYNVSNQIPASLVEHNPDLGCFFFFLICLAICYHLVEKYIIVLPVTVTTIIIIFGSN